MHHHPALQPYDTYNQTLESHVHPRGWTNPAPAGCYNLLVVGGGPAGLVAAVGAAGLGAKVALVERDLLGGDCLNVGCVPSKSLLAAGRVAATVRDAQRFGMRLPVPHNAGAPSVDFAAVMDRLRRQRAGLSPHDGVARLQSLGIDVFFGTGQFVDHQTFVVGSGRLRFTKAIVATGARAARPTIPGLHDIAPLTNETIFSLTELPRRLTVIGGGPIGTELAQCFARFGSLVTQIEQGPRLLGKDDPDASAVVQRSLEHDGVRLCFNATIERCLVVEGAKRVIVQTPTGRLEVDAEAVLVAAGRAPNVEQLGLEEAGVAYDLRRGIHVDDRLATSNGRIYAAGDVCATHKFTHAADFMARLAIQNALFWGRRRVSALTIPRCTYTAPELAQVGLTAAEAEERGIAIDTYTQPLSQVDRAVLDDAAEGFVRVHTRRGGDRLVGATVVAEHAGDMIGHLTCAMTHGLRLRDLGATIHPYPTQAEAIRKLGDQYNRTRLTPLVRRLFSTWLAWWR